MSSTTEIRNRIFTNIVAAVQQIDATFNPDPLDKSVTNAIATATAPEFKLLEILIQNAAKQGNPITADSKRDSDIGALEDWGQLYLNRQPTAATGGRYELTVTGTGTIPAGTQYVNQLTGFVYLVQTTVVVSGSGTVTVASSGTGSEVSLTVGTELYSQQTITGINNPAAVATETVEPFDAETIEEYRAEIITAAQVTPRGGARGDYVVWGKEVAGVRTVYPYSGVALNDMTIYVQETITASNPQGEASSAIVEAVDTNIRAEQPITAGTLITTSIIRRGYNVEIDSLSDPTYQTTIQNTLDSYFATRQPFIDGVDPNSTRADLISRSQAFSNVTNAIQPATIDDLRLYFSGSEVITENLPDGTIPFTSTINYL